MPKFIPYEKCSKKKRREADKGKRGSWGTVNPVTRKPEKSNVYDRTKQTRRWKADIDSRRGGLDAIEVNIA